MSIDVRRVCDHAGDTHEMFTVDMSQHSPATVFSSSEPQMEFELLNEAGQKRIQVWCGEVLILPIGKVYQQDWGEPG